ncbi:MAG: HNH endonuclease [Clostridiales bacterium]|nr:HNH endonuclease [Clostridiales bacterium]
MAEIWKDIPGYEGEYQVSDMGRVKSLDRKIVQRSRWGTDFERTITGRILRPGQFCKNGHVSVVLKHGGIGKPVHQLVMRAFVGEPPEGMEVRHINGNPKDNRLENLCYGTRTENILDVYTQGKKWRALSLEDVYYIRFALFCGLSGRQIADYLGVSESTVSDVKRGRTYSWLK